MKMWKYLTHKVTTCYVDALGELLYLYKRARHRKIGRALIDVTKENEVIVRQRIFCKEEHSSLAKYKVEDQVLTVKTRRTFDTGYLPNLTEEIFADICCYQYESTYV